MTTVSKKNLLFRHIESDLYDVNGFVDYNKLSVRLQLKIKGLASAIGKTPRALQKNPGSEKIQKELKKLVVIFMRLKEMLENENEILIWLKAPNPDYNDLSPLDVISQGKLDSIIGYLEDIRKGALT